MTEPTRELTGEEASRYLRERMMFPTAEQLESWGVRPQSMISHLDRLRDVQRRLKDNDSIEDFIAEHDETQRTVTHALVAREANRLYKSVVGYQASAQPKRFVPDFDALNVFERTSKGLRMGELMGFLRPLAGHERSHKVKFNIEASIFEHWFDTEAVPGPSELRVSDLIMNDLNWRPGSNMQAMGRLRRHINAIKLPGMYASRNEREGVYNFKVKGKHRRKRRQPKIVILSIDAATSNAIDRLRAKADLARKEIK